MKTTDKEGTPCRGFIVHWNKDGLRPRKVSYGTDKPLCMAEAVKLCNSGMDRGLRVVVETDGPGGKEYMSGKALVQVAEYAGEEMFSDDARMAHVEIERKEHRLAIAEKASRRLIAPDLDTTADFLDPREAANPLLAFNFAA